MTNEQIEKLRQTVRDREQEAIEAHQENDELRAALQLFANEICQRRMLGFVQDAVFERVNNNQICRTALTDTGYKGVK